MRSRILSLTLGLCIPGLIGCGDDTNGTTPDASSVDAAPDGPERMFKGYDADEAGEVRVEYVRFAGGNAATRVTSFVFKDSGSTKFFPYPNLRGCTNVVGKMNWPLATNPAAERVYADPGKIIISGGPMNLEVARRTMMGTDPFGRTHPANSWNFHFPGGMGTDGPTYLPEKAKLDVIFTGSADMPGQIYDDVLYMPADFALTTPGVAPFPIPAGQAQTFSWTTPADSPPPGYEVMSLVAFTGPDGPAVLCIEPNDGSITVPADMIDVVRAKYPGGGTLARQTFTHVTREFVDRNGPTGRRLDFVAVWCYATGFVVP